MYKKQPLIRARGVSYCKNLLSPRFEHTEGMFTAHPTHYPNFPQIDEKTFLVDLNCFLVQSFHALAPEEESVENLDKTYYVFLPPELCLIHPLPGSLVRGAQRLPSIMKRVESMLLAIQLKEEINYPVPSSKVLFPISCFISAFIIMHLWPRSFTYILTGADLGGFNSCFMSGDSLL